MSSDVRLEPARSLLNRPSWLDALVILGITVFVGVLSGSERWTGVDTPDSGFYATLALYGDEVTERAPDTSYYLTRLGYILPAHVVTSALGPWVGFAAWRMLLIGLLVASSYLVLHRYVPRPAAATLTTLTALSSAVLSYLGNTYLTGTVLALMMVAVAAGIIGRGMWSAVLAGAVLGWLVMINPYGAFLAGGLWAALVVAAVWQPNPRAPRTLLPTALIAMASGVVVFFGFLLAGRVMFPSLDWLGVYLEWNAKVDYANFASPGPIWLTDISMLVPALMLVISIGVWIGDRANPQRLLALVISVSLVVLVFTFRPFMAGITLEMPAYQVMLWPPLLLALALAASPVFANAQWSARTFLVAGAAIILVIVAGHYPGILPGLVGIVLAIGTAVIAVVGLLRTRSAVVAIVIITAVLVASALLQNSRRDIGLYYLSPYSWAFQANPISQKMHTAVNTQDWLLANTTRDDQILLWVDGAWVEGDRDLYAVAAMQLWGENRVTLEKTLQAADIARLREIRPTVLALYGPSMDGIYAFWESIPRDLDPTAPTCYDFAWPTPERPIGHACLTTLRWSAPATGTGAGDGSSPR